MPNNLSSPVIDAGQPGLDLRTASSAAPTIEMPAPINDGGDMHAKNAPTIPYDPLKYARSGGANEQTVDIHARAPLPDPDGEFSHRRLMELSDEELNNAYKTLTDKIWAAEKYIAAGDDPDAQDFLHKAYQWQANAVLARRERGLSQDSHAQPMSEIIQNFSRTAGVDPAISDKQLLNRRGIATEAREHLEEGAGQRTDVLKYNHSELAETQEHTLGEPTQPFEPLQAGTTEKFDTSALFSELDKAGRSERYMPNKLRNRMRNIGNRILSFALGKTMELSAKSQYVPEFASSRSGADREAIQPLEADFEPFSFKTHKTADTGIDEEHVVTLTPAHTTLAETQSQRTSHDATAEHLDNNRDSLIKDVAIRLGITPKDVADRVRQLSMSNHDVMILDDPSGDDIRLQVLFPAEDNKLQFVKDPNMLIAALAGAEK